MRDPFVIVSYGAGTNSTAMLVGMRERNEIPDLILFADTGGEKPHTYTHLAAMQAWCADSGFPEIVVVQSQYRDGRYYTLEQRCLEQRMLPSIVYGFKACSEKHKRRPQDKFCANDVRCQAVWAGGGKVTKCIGFDADESHRAAIPEDGRYRYRYPLLEWGWGRDECESAILAAGLPLPGKSACFFCPSSKKREILELRRLYPDLMARAVAMEANAETTSVKGLGRDFAWSDLVKWDEAQLNLFSNDSRVEIDCGCYDG